MKSTKPHSDVRAVILLRTLPGLPRRVQERMGTDAGVTHTYDADNGGPIEIERYVKDARAGDTYWLPSLLCLTLPPKHRPDDYSPSADLGAKVANILSRGAVVTDIRGRGKGAISSTDATKFADHVAYSIGYAAQGERVLTAKARKARADRGIVARWKSPAMKDKREAQQIIWTSTRLDEAGKRKRLDPELAGASLPTLYTVLGPMFPGIPSKGGRPPKRQPD
jgi:hypothetical protein